MGELSFGAYHFDLLHSSVTSPSCGLEMGRSASLHIAGGEWGRENGDLSPWLGSLG